MRPLAYLHLRLFVNSVKHTLRTPRRLVPMVLLAAWAGQSVIFSTVMALDPEAWQSMKVHIPAARMDQIWSACFISLTATVVTLVYNSLRDGLLIFAPPHIDFLFPAPIKRRSVLLMKLFGDYGRYAAYVIFVGVFALQGYMLIGMHASTAFYAAVGALLLLSFVTNATHLLNVVTSYGVARLKITARVVKFSLVLVVSLLFVTALGHYVATGDAAGSLAVAAQNALAEFLLAPIVWCTNLIVGSTPGMVHNPMRELAWLAILAGGSLFALLRRPENFYEPSLAISARMARIRAAMNTGDWSSVAIEKRRDMEKARSAGLSIPPFGRGAVSLVWKYMAVQCRRMGWSMLALVLLPPITALAARSLVHDAEVLKQSPYAILYVVWGFIFAAQADLRSELRQTDVIKAIPIRGFKIILAQVFGQWLQLSVFALVAAVSIRWMIPEADGETLAIALVGSLSISISCISWSAIAVMLYPDCRDRLQLIVPGFVSLVLVGLTVLPSVAIIVRMLALGERLLSISVTLVLINILLAWMGLWIAGALFERYDPTAQS